MQTSVKKLSNDHEEWKNTLNFYKDELRFFKKMLEELAAKNNKNEILVEIEKYENKFRIHHEKIDTLKHGINEHLQNISKEIAANANHISKEEVEEHGRLKEGFETETNIFEELKKDYKQMLAKYM